MLPQHTTAVLSPATFIIACIIAADGENDKAAISTATHDSATAAAYARRGVGPGLHRFSTYSKRKASPGGATKQYKPTL